jgi:hypothetical protein
MKKLLVGALCAVATTAASASPAAAAPPAVNVKKVVQSVLDKLYDDYVEEYWVWAFNQPEEVNPLLGSAPFCAESENGRVTFLSGTFLDGPQERSCDVSRGQFLYLSILSSSYIAFESDPPQLKTYEAMMSFANCTDDATSTVTVDGKTIDVSWSNTKTGIFDFPVEEGGFLEAALGGENTDGAVATGIHVMLPPLPRGKHTVSWHAESEACGLVKDITYKLNIR